MNRQAMEFPDDENGDVLRRMATNGDDLSLPRNVDFTVVFPNESAAQQFAMHFHELGYATSVELTATAESFPWDVVIVKHMVPLHRDIGSFENELQTVAGPIGGHNDGWGCLSED
jgi:hypothetical protein